MRDAHTLYSAEETLAVILHFLRQEMRNDLGIESEVLLLNGRLFLQVELRDAWLVRKQKQPAPTGFDNALSVFQYREFGAYRESRILDTALLLLEQRVLYRQVSCSATIILLPTLERYYDNLICGDNSYKRFHLRDELQRIAREIYPATRKY